MGKTKPNRRKADSVLRDVAGQGGQAASEQSLTFAELDAFYRTAPVGLCMVDTELRFVRINERLAAIGGLSPAAHLGRTLRQVVPNLADQIEPLYRKVIATGEPLLDMEVSGATPEMPDVDRVWQCSYLPVKLEIGNVVGVNAFVVDITAIKEVARELRIFQHIVSGSHDHLSFVDSNYVYRAVNNAYLVAHAKPREQIIGRQVAELLGKELFEAVVKPKFDECLCGRQVRYQDWFEFPGIGKHFMDVMYNPFVDDDGKISGVIVSARNFSEQHRAEEALRESQTQLTLIADTIDDVVWITDWTNQKVLFCNAAYERIWGRPLRRLYHNAADWIQAIHADDQERVRRSFQGLGERGSFDVEYRVVRPDGSMRWIRDRGFGVRDRDGEILRVAGIANDITERKQSEEARHQLENQLRHAQKMEAVGQLAAGMAHDVNSLFTVILGNAEILENTLKKRKVGGSAQTRTALEGIQEAVIRGKELIQKLLTFGRVRSVKPGRVDLNRIVTDTLGLVGSTLDHKIRLEKRQAADLNCCTIDAGQMQQVIMNLILNARDAMPKGGDLIVETANVDLTDADAATRTEARPGPHVVLTVCDTGMGMDAGVLERIFEPFFSTKPVNQASGLGLSIVYAIVKQAGGHVRVESRVGQGSTFRVYLPAAV